MIKNIRLLLILIGLTVLTQATAQEVAITVTNPTDNQRQEVVEATVKVVSP